MSAPVVALSRQPDRRLVDRPPTKTVVSTDADERPSYD
jgi:hypothetical protein